jgi:hypothetical protein
MDYVVQGVLNTQMLSAFSLSGISFFHLSLTRLFHPLAL